MTMKQTNQATTGLLSRWGRPLAMATAVVFVISSVFPLVAGFVKDTNSWPKWWGVLDVSIAFILAILAILVLGLANGKVDHQVETTTYRSCIDGSDRVP